MKYVVVSGGVVSGLGKGITSSSLGVLLKACGLRVSNIKIDPYLNIDAGVLSPFEHGEVFVLDDGGEVDLDLGNYERFLQTKLTKDHNITTGKIYQEVISKERRGDYLGKTVQVVPHVTDAIMEWIERVAAIPVDGSKLVPDVCIIELGGTVGDIESMVFLEALRQFKFRLGPENFCHAHVSLVPIVGSGPDGEQKSKPTQHGVKELRTAGLPPDMIVCRSSKPISRSTVAKISTFCMVPSTHIVSVHDVSNIYKVPLLMLQQRVPELVLGILRLNRMPPESLPDWENFSEKVDSPKKEVTIGIVGKYTGTADTYLSITKALFHAAIEADFKLNIEWIESNRLEDQYKKENRTDYDDAWAQLKRCNGVLIPGGFGDRGIEGKIAAVKYARTSNVPFLGICLGLQVAVIEFARNVLGVPKATSEEFDPKSEVPYIVFMPEGSTTQKGGTMRLGSRATAVADGTLAMKLYGASVVDERHRHRYEVNPACIAALEKKGLVFSGKDAEKGVRMEILEYPTNKFFFGTQYHPEYKSSPFRPSPPFRGFIRASAGVDQDFSPPSSVPCSPGVVAPVSPPAAHGFDKMPRFEQISLSGSPEFKSSKRMPEQEDEHSLHVTSKASSSSPSKPTTVLGTAQGVNPSLTKEKEKTQPETEPKGQAEPQGDKKEKQTEAEPQGEKKEKKPESQKGTSKNGKGKPQKK